MERGLEAEVRPKTAPFADFIATPRRWAVKVLTELSPERRVVGITRGAQATRAGASLQRASSTSDLVEVERSIDGTKVGEVRRKHVALGTLIVIRLIDTT